VGFFLFVGMFGFVLGWWLPMVGQPIPVAASTWYFGKASMG
jgi:hypothetical protein